MAAKPANSSLDQFLAVEKGLGAATRKSNVVLAVGSTDLTAANALSFSAGGVGVGEDHLALRGLRLLCSAASFPPNDAAGQAALKRKNALGQSVIDYVRADVSRLRTRLAPVEQQKMDQHLSAIRDLEKTFASMPAGATCVGPRPGRRPAASRRTSTS